VISKSATESLAIICVHKGSWSAVALGAVIQAVAKQYQAPYWAVTSRRAISHMGLGVSTEYKPSIHSEDEKYVMFPDN
jgi:hypothetical protein